MEEREEPLDQASGHATKRTPKEKLPLEPAWAFCPKKTSSARLASLKKAWRLAWHGFGICLESPWYWAASPSFVQGLARIPNHEKKLPSSHLKEVVHAPLEIRGAKGYQALS